MTLDQKYPNISSWIIDGCIELGNCHDGYSDATAMAMDEGGVIWETSEHFQTLDDLLNALEKGIEAYCKEHGIE